MFVYHCGVCVCVCVFVRKLEELRNSMNRFNPHSLSPTFVYTKICILAFGMKIQGICTQKVVS